MREFLHSLKGVALRFYVDPGESVANQWQTVQNLMGDSDLDFRRVTVLHPERGTSNESAQTQDVMDQRMQTGFPWGKRNPTESIALLLETRKRSTDFEYRLFTNRALVVDRTFGGHVRLTTHSYWVMPAAHHWADPQPWCNPAVQAFYL